MIPVQNLSIALKKLCVCMFVCCISLKCVTIFNAIYTDI